MKACCFNSVAVSLPHGVMVWSAVYDSGISCSYSRAVIKFRHDIQEKGFSHDKVPSYILCLDHAEQCQNQTRRV